MGSQISWQGLNFEDELEECQTFSLQLNSLHFELVNICLQFVCRSRRVPAKLVGPLIFPVVGYHERRNAFVLAAQKQKSPLTFLTLITQTEAIMSIEIIAEQFQENL